MATDSHFTDLRWQSDGRYDSENPDVKVDCMIGDSEIETYRGSSEEDETWTDFDAVIEQGAKLRDSSKTYVKRPNFVPPRRLRSRYAVSDTGSKTSTDAAGNTFQITSKSWKSILNNGKLGSEKEEIIVKKTVKSKTPPKIKETVVGKVVANANDKACKERKTNDHARIKGETALKKAEARTTKSEYKGLDCPSKADGESAKTQTPQPINQAPNTISELTGASSLIKSPSTGSSDSDYCGLFKLHIRDDQELYKPIETRETSSEVKEEKLPTKSSAEVSFQHTAGGPSEHELKSANGATELVKPQAVAQYGEDGDERPRDSVTPSGVVIYSVEEETTSDISLHKAKVGFLCNAQDDSSEATIRFIESLETVGPQDKKHRIHESLSSESRVGPVMLHPTLDSPIASKLSYPKKTGILSLMLSPIRQPKLFPIKLKDASFTGMTKFNREESPTHHTFPRVHTHRYRPADKDFPVLPGNEAEQTTRGHDTPPSPKLLSRTTLLDQTLLYRKLSEL